MGKKITVEDLREAAEGLVAAEPGRLASEGRWQRPLVVSAAIDGRFDRLPEIAYHEHLSPRDLLPTARSVVVFFIPWRKMILTGAAAGIGSRKTGALCIPLLICRNRPMCAASVPP